MKDTTGFVGFESVEGSVGGASVGEAGRFGSGFADGANPEGLVLPGGTGGGSL